MRSIFCATFRLKSDVDENEMLECVEKAYPYFRKAPGFISLNAVKLAEREYALVEVHESKETHDNWASDYWPELANSDAFRKWSEMVEIRERTRGVIVASSDSE